MAGQLITMFHYTCGFLNFSPPMFRGKTHHKQTARARAIFAYVASEAGFSYKDIGRVLRQHPETTRIAAERVEHDYGLLCRARILRKHLSTRLARDEKVD